MDRTGLPNDYVLRVYAGWLGKVIGVRHGGNIEGWTYDRIAQTFGEVTGYLHHFKNFAADDDTNGPMFFLRALDDYTYTTDLTPEQIGLGWLNYAGDGHGFFWWGGYGKSTEHTAYLNMKHGIMAPASGSIAQNGAAVAEQIGGQIFIDVWGLVCPGKPKLASHYAEKAASVSHDGNGKYGGMFVAACIAEAFIESDVRNIVEAGLSVIPSDCEYTRMVRAVLAYYQDHKDNWRDCFQYVYDNFGYDRYPGVCHIIPNSAVIVLSLLYGEGDFSKAINICNMCGWDTDCNVANVGTIMGVRNGLDGIDQSWRTPINDFLCCSSVIGTLNMLDLPGCASWISRLGYQIAGVEPPAEWAAIVHEEGARCHFEFPGSTHAFRIDCDANLIGRVENSEGAAASGSRSLKVVFNEVKGDCALRAYLKTYYHPEDFNDSRYDPSFSPLLYPGQSVEASVMVPGSNSPGVTARLYVYDRNHETYHYGSEVSLKAGEWTKLTFDIPRLNDACLECAGVEWTLLTRQQGEFMAYLDDFHYGGLPDYQIDFAKERLEKWTGTHIEVSQCTYLRGIWTLENGQLSGSYFGEPAECYTGDVKWSDYVYSVSIIPKVGMHHNILFRVQGGIRSYAVGFAPDSQLVLYKNENGYRELTSAPFSWEPGRTYHVTVEAHGNHFNVSVDGLMTFTYTDDEFPYLHGQVGFSNLHGSHTHYAGFAVKGI